MESTREPRTYSKQDYRDALRRHADPDGHLSVVDYERRRAPADPTTPRVLQAWGQWNTALTYAGLNVRTGNEGLNKYNSNLRYSEELCILALVMAATDTGYLAADLPLSYANYEKWVKAENERKGDASHRWPGAVSIRNRLAKRDEDGFAYDATWHNANLRAGLPARSYRLADRGGERIPYMLKNATQTKGNDA